MRPEFLSSPQDRGGGIGNFSERNALKTPELAAIKQRVFPVAETLTHDTTAKEIVAAMVGNDPERPLYPPQDAADIVAGERGRVLGLGGAYWPFLYGLPLQLMDKSGKHVQKLFEIGPSLESHLGALPPTLQPSVSVAVDFPHIARGAEVSIAAMKEKGIIDKDAVYYVGTEQDIPPRYQADASISVLEAQYDEWKELATKLFRHSDTAIVGDVLHGLTRSPFTRGKKISENDSVAFNTSSQPDNPSGFRLVMGKQIGDSYGNRRYQQYSLATDAKIIGEDKKIHNITTKGQQEGVCTIITDPKTGQEYIQAWTFRPKDGVPDAEIQKVIEVEETLHDLYAYTKNWDGLGALGVLHELKRNSWGRRKQLGTIVATTILPASEMSGRLPLSILFINKEKLQERAGKNQLRHIGREGGKKYKSVGEFLAMVQNELMTQTPSGKPRIDELVTFDPPPLIDIIASKNDRLIEEMVAVANQ